LKSQQSYRRGCECFYGTNGYGEGDEVASKALGLSLLNHPLILVTYMLRIDTGSVFCSGKVVTKMRQLRFDI
jgi:hypothetical protein